MRLPRICLAVGIATTAIAAASTASAYRTAAELPSVNSESPVRWAGQSFGYVVTNRAPAGILLANYLQEINQAIATWTKLDCTSLYVRNLGTVVSSATPGDGLNTVEWVPAGWLARGFDPDVPGQTDVMYERDATGNWYIKEADIYLNGEQNTWDLAGETHSSAWSVRSVVLHEAGHALGLLHPCEITGDATVPSCSASSQFDDLAMNPVYDVGLSSLSSDDQAGLCSIYPKGLCVDRICGESETCTLSGCRLTCGDGTCDAGQVCDLGRCLEPSQASALVAGLPRDSSCSKRSDCQRGLSCISGSCKGGSSKLGDPCLLDKECQDGVCTQAGYCAQACRTAGDCVEIDASCGEVTDGVGACFGAAASFGSACNSADDCIGQECLVDGEQAAVCTRGCVADLTSCPDGWRCATVEGKAVCTTAAVESGCGCRFVDNSSRSRIKWVLAVLVSTIMILRRGQGGSRSVA